MNAHTSLWLALPLALLLPVACNNAASTASSPEAAGTAATAEAPAAAAAAPRAHKKHHARGPAAMMLHAAKSLDLSADQRATIDQIATDLRADQATIRSAQRAEHAALVSGVRAGNVDLAALAPLQAAVTQAHTAHLAREARALNGLYAALQPAQRQALVASVRAKQAEHAARWAGAQEAEPAAAPVASAARRIAHLTTQLGLDADQQQKLAAIPSAAPQPADFAARREAMRARMDALLTAFSAEAFDASKLDLGTPEVGAAHEQGHAAFLAKLVPILRADQRENLAASMEAHHRS